MSYNCNSDDSRFRVAEYVRQDLVYEKENLLISGPGKYPDYNFYRVTGMAVMVKKKVKHKKKVHQLMYGAYYHDVAILFDGTCGHRFDNSCCDKYESCTCFLS
jgi:hypothetical protein